METNTTTPFNRRTTIRITRDRRGRRIAHYLSRSYMCSWMWLRIPIADADIFIAMDQADLADDSTAALVCS